MSGQDREQTVYGRKACWAIFAQRSQDIQRIYHAGPLREELAPLLKWAAAAHVLTRELDEEGLRRVSEATHHEGLVLSVKPLRYAGPDDALPGRGTVWVALDRVANPYNAGAILRSCAFFAVERVLVSGVIPGGSVNTAALRAAEGGAETVQLVAAEPLAPVLLALGSRGIPIIGLESDARAAFGAEPLVTPSVLVLGHEQEGLSPAVRSACTQLCAIPGKGAVSSLNVSVTAGIALALLTLPARRSGSPPVRDTREHREPIRPSRAKSSSGPQAPSAKRVDLSRRRSRPQRGRIPR
jgi:TrmH RNA methyltransferase